MAPLAVTTIRPPWRQAATAACRRGGTVGGANQRSVPIRQRIIVTPNAARDLGDYIMNRTKRRVTIHLPEEFLELCKYDMVTPERVLRGFIADLCGIVSWASNPRTDQYSSNGSDERDFARAYYDRVGYRYEAQFIRDQHDTTNQKSSGHFNCRQRTN